MLARAAGILGIALIGGLDYYSGIELRIFPLYYVPIALLAWHDGRSGAWVGTILSTATWAGVNLLAGLRFTHPGMWAANSLMQGTSFAVVGVLIATLRAALIRERGLSRTDPLTSMLNSRAFHEQAARILALCRRAERPVTVACIDLDNFKTINDTLGHQAGDHLLKTVAGLLHSTLRPSDVAARLGGDEFVVLLPETGPRDAANVLERMRAALSDTLAAGGSLVTASIGGVTFMRAPEQIEDLVHQSDLRMYVAKNAGKNCVEYEVIG
jgi:diguanylate cyclase (GGDEF)-like protein